MSYIKDNLMPNERILFSAQVHPAVFIQSAFAFTISIALIIYTFSLASHKDPFAGMLAGFFLLISVGALLASIILGLEALFIMLTTEFAVTNRRVIAKTGFIRRRTLEMFLPKIESVAVRQTILGRILNFGTVTVTGTGGTRENFRAIVEPVSVRRKINQIIEQSTQNYNQQQPAAIQITHL